MFKWTKAQVRAGNIPAALDHNAEVSNYKGVLNGGLDRDNLPSGPSSIDHLMVEDEAFQKYSVVTGIRLDAALEPAYSGVTETAGMSFEQYSGGWHVHLDDSISDSWVEGHMWVVFNAWMWQAKERAYSVGPPASVNKVYAQFRILFNGAVVCESDIILLGIQQVHMETVFPCPSGSGTIQIAWKVSSPTGLEPASDTRIFTFAGGKLLAVNRYR